MKKRFSSIVTVIAIGLAFLSLVYVNKNNYISIAQTVVSKLQGNSDIQAKNTIAGILRDNFTYRSAFIDTYGLSKRVLGERIIGNNEFLKDESGIMQLIQEPQPYDNYLSSLKELSQTLEEKNIPYIYLNLPDRGKSFSAADTAYYWGKKYNDVMTQVRNMNIDELNLDERLIETSLVPYKDFFFRTDVHLCTKTEFHIAKLLTEYLTEKYSVTFPNTNEVYDFNMYVWKDYDFCGNLCNYSSGRFYNGTDIFQTFEPQFNTHLRLNIPSANVEKEGTFYDVMTNQYDAIDGTPYWITNYGQYPQPYYFYDNLLYPDGPSLLVICDSMFMRMNTFLALNSSHITVVDPRVDDGVDHVTACLNEKDYDAVIVGDTGFLNNFSFGRKYNIPESTLPLQQVSYNGMWLDYVNDVDLNTNGLIPGQIDSQYYHDSETVSLVGWAADFNVNMPLSKLYLIIGEHTLECKYGIERTSVSDYFQNPNLVMTGFTVSFPKKYLDEVDAVEFIQVGADGSYRFETVTYRLSN